MDLKRIPYSNFGAGTVPDAVGFASEETNHWIAVWAAGLPTAASVLVLDQSDHGQKTKRR
jgi:hypothetical protein